MAVFKCKMCGSPLNIKKDEHIVECEYCGIKQTVPIIKTKEIEELYERANYFFHNNEYDKAADIYENIGTENPYDPESYFMLALCKYGIEYVEDPKTKKRIPTLHRLHYESISNDINFKKAIKHADSTQKILYEQEAKYIDEVRNKILDISKKEKPYDVFICYKETDEKGQRTKDSVLAMDIYNELTKDGLKVFFSRVTLESKLGIDYEPYIFAALNSAKVMIVVGTKPEYINSPWVRNEWTRFLDRINKSKSSKKNTDNCYVVPAYKGMSPYALPNEFSSVQAQDMSKVGAIQDLVDGVKKLISKSSNVENIEVKFSKKIGIMGIAGIVSIVFLILIGIFFVFNANRKVTIRGVKYKINESYDTLSLQEISDFNEQDVSQLKKIKSIKNLYFKNCVLENLEFLCDLPNVRGVQFNSATKVKNSSIKNTCENIETFKIEVDKRTNWDNIEVLKKMPNLKEICIPLCVDLTPISHHSELIEITIYMNNSMIDNFLWCEGLENVKKFSIFGGGYTRKDNLFQGIEYLRSIEELYLTSGSINGEPYINNYDLYYIGKLENLKILEIRLSGSRFVSSVEEKNNLDLANIKGLKKLEKLILNIHNNFELSPLPSLYNLKSVELSGDVINDDLQCLKNLNNLETLSLRIKGRQRHSTEKIKRTFSLNGIQYLKKLNTLVIYLEYYGLSTTVYSSGNNVRYEINDPGKIELKDEDLAKNIKNLNYQVIEDVTH